ncbi:MAG: glycosyltransferase family 4 protein [Anaerolineae bacterium]
MLVSPYDIAIPGGVTKHVIGLAQALERRGHFVRVLAPCSAPPASLAAIGLDGTLQSVSSHVLSWPYAGAVSHISVDPRIAGRIRSLLAADAFDIMHVHEPLAPGVSWAALAAAHRYPGMRVVGTFHAYREGPNRLYRCVRPLWRAAMRLLDGHVAVSTATAAFWNQFVNASFRLIPNGIDAQLLRTVAPERDRLGAHVLFVGRLEPRKGLDVLLRAWRQVERQHADARLTIAGAYTRQDEATYRRQAAELALRRIRFVGPQSEASLAACYRQADIVCAPARGFESFGLVILEAMAAGVPVVASDIAGYRTLVTPDRDGLLVPAGDDARLATALTALLRDPERRRCLGEQGRLTARRYTWDHVVPRLLDYYDEINHPSEEKPEEKSEEKPEEKSEEKSEGKSEGKKP